MESIDQILAAARIFPVLTDHLRSGEACYLVGGALRNWLLGRETTDFDFATPADPTPLARRFAARVGGRWFFLDAGRGQSRVVARIGGRVLTFDFAPFRGPDLAADLRLRDFTINALALPLLPDGGMGDLLDPLGGREDLARGRLRECSPGVFRDDPLRVLKGVRHAADLGFRPKEKTCRRMREAGRLLPTVAAERIRSELFLIFSASPVASGLELLQELSLPGILFGPPGGGGEWGRALALADRTEQVAACLRRFDLAGGLTRVFDQELEAELTRLTLVKFSAFLRGYAPPDLSGLLLRLRLGRRSAALVRSLAGLSPERLAEANRLDCGMRGRALWAASLGPSPWESLLFLAVLDREEKEAAAARVFPVFQDVRETLVKGRIPDLVDGGWIRDHLGLSEGPAIGALLRRLRRAEIAGRVTTREEAERFLSNLAEKRD